MKVPEFFSRFLSLSNFAKSIPQAAGRWFSGFNAWLFDKEKGRLRGLRSLGKWAPAGAGSLLHRLSSWFFRFQNIITGWVIRLRVLFQSSPQYRSVVFVLMSALAVSIILAMVFLAEPQRGAEPSPALADEPHQSGNITENQQLSDDSPEFPSSIFSDEELPLEANIPVSPPPEAKGPEDNPKPAADSDAAASERLERIYQEANLELRRTQDQLRQEIEKLQVESEKSRLRNERNRELLDRYERENKELRRQLREKERAGS